MIKKIKISVICALAIVALGSCAQEKEENSYDIQKKILEAYLAVNYPNAERTPSGLTYISKTPGTGDTLKTLNFAYVNYTTKSLEGVYTATNDSLLLKRLGQFVKSKYFGPKLYTIGVGNTMIGLEEMLIGMRVGGSATAIIPPWLTSTEYSSSQNSSVSAFYDYKLIRVIKNIETFQLDSMKAYAKTRYPGLDTISKGFYYKHIKNILSPAKDTIAADTTINVRYVGRLLDGFIFDTNIADSAKRYGIYSSSNTYDPLSVTMNKDLDALVESSSLVRGFCMALQKMKYFGDESIAIFYSELGYKAEGKGDIGPYQPMIFRIYIEPKK